MEKTQNANGESDETLSKADRKSLDELIESKYFIHLVKECINRVMSESFKRYWRYVTAFVSILLVILGYLKIDYEIKINKAGEKFAEVSQRADSLNAVFDSIEEKYKSISALKEKMDILFYDTKLSQDQYLNLLDKQTGLVSNQSNFLGNQISRFSATKDSIIAWSRNVEDSLKRLSYLTGLIDKRAKTLMSDYDRMMSGFSTTLDQQLEEWDQTTRKIRKFASQNLVVNRGKRDSTEKRYYPSTLILPEDTLVAVYYDYNDDAGLKDSRVVSILMLKNKPVVLGTAFLDIYINGKKCIIDSLVEGNDYQEIEGTDYQIKALSVDKKVATLEVSLN